MAPDRRAATAALAVLAAAAAGGLGVWAASARSRPRRLQGGWPARGLLPARCSA